MVVVLSPFANCCFRKIIGSCTEIKRAIHEIEDHGVDLFLGLHANQLTILERGYQVIAQRTPKREDLSGVDPMMAGGAG